MTFKASLNGPNRAAASRRDAGGSATSQDSGSGVVGRTTSHGTGGENGGTQHRRRKRIPFRIRSLEKYLEDVTTGRIRTTTAGADGVGTPTKNVTIPPFLGDACLVRRGRRRRKKNDDCGGGRGGRGSSSSVKALKEWHSELVQGGADEEPILIHFHDIPVIILRAVIDEEDDEEEDDYSSFDGNDKQEEENKVDDHVLDEEEDDVIYLSDVHCYNHKICEETRMEVTCCSRQSDGKDYDPATRVGVEVHTKRSNTSNESMKEEEGKNSRSTSAIPSVDIGKVLASYTSQSVLTVNELIVVHLGDDNSGSNTEVICRVYGIHVDPDPTSILSSGIAAMEEPYRGRVTPTTQFYVDTASTDDDANGDDSSSSAAGVVPIITNGERLPGGELPEDVIHITTSDGEWFPVKRLLLAPCLELTPCVQHGRGKYANVPVPTSPMEDRSVDAPLDDGRPHWKVDVDCCTFDRVLLFLLSTLYPQEKQFTLDVTEVNAMADAAVKLGLQPLSDLCKDQSRSFEKRVRKTNYIPLEEVIKRNDNEKNKELLLILDGMVLDITRWIDHHPGGPSIIPSQALNIDCGVFFEMYHVSKQSFLYLKSFYVGELSPDDHRSVLRRTSGDGSRGGNTEDVVHHEPSPAFLESLRSYTKKWRVKINVDLTVHKSL